MMSTDSGATFLEESATTPGEEPSVNDNLELLASEGFADWLNQENVSLAFGTPPSKFWMVGVDDEGELSIFDRVLDKVMGLATDGHDRLSVATRYEIWHFENMLKAGTTTDSGHDRLFVPRSQSIVGNVNIHDLGIDKDGKDIWVNTRFGCLASSSDHASFIPRWIPPFLDGALQGDRCHLNGLAMVDGEPRYVTCVGQTNEVDSWRDGRRDQGIVIDIRTNQILGRGMSMPHSPRFYRDKIWVANAGTGELGYIDTEQERFEPIFFGPGFLRGLCFVGDYAVVGSSKPRRGDLYSGLPLDEKLEESGMDAHLGLFVVNITTGELAHWLLVEGNVRELFDVCVLNGAKRPAIIGLLGSEIATELWFDDSLPIPQERREAVPFQ